MIPDFAPADGTRVERRKAVGCRDGAKVELFAVRGAGHTWPSGWQYLPESLIGATSSDIDAAVAAWRFFQSTL
jgi:polyhydroxybutyrate depolymerase